MTKNYAAAKRKVLVLGGPLAYADRKYLKEFEDNYQVDHLPARDRAETKDKLPKKIAEDGPYEALIVKMGTIPYQPYDEDLLSSIVPGCRIIASASAGFNEFDIDWMTEAGIWFCNTIDAVSEATADMTLFLILATIRNTTNAERQARNGEWKTGLTPSQSPDGKTLGIVGLGSIGKYVATKAKVFNMHIRYYNRHRLPADEEAKYAATHCASLHELLSSSELVSLHTPLNAATTGMMSKSEFEAMRDGSFLINTARGAIVDEQAMIEALENGKLTRAGLDVFPDEPEISDYLKNSDKVVLQPHMGGLTESTFAKSEKECLENIRALFEKSMPNSPVNVPKR